LSYDTRFDLIHAGVGANLIRKGPHVQTLRTLATLILRFSASAGRGQGLAEYALILALIAIVAIVALIFLGGQVSGILNKVGTSV
jgi:Flp pilus assembly pilin Flp